jgi:hypothetical protein
MSFTPFKFGQSQPASTGFGGFGQQNPSTTPGQLAARPSQPDSKGVQYTNLKADTKFLLENDTFHLSVLFWICSFRETSNWRVRAACDTASFTIR